MGDEGGGVPDQAQMAQLLQNPQAMAQMLAVPFLKLQLVFSFFISFYYVQRWWRNQILHCGNKCNKILRL